MSIVTLVSGGLDSTLIGILAKEEGITAYPLFVDYGQIAVDNEWKACISVHERYSLPQPVRLDVSGFGKLIKSGLTSADIDVKENAFTPGRNLLLLLLGSSYAFQVNAQAVSMGILSERYSLFPDQRSAFIEKAELAIEAALGKSIRVVLPLFEFSKADVIAIARERGIDGTYSCHSGRAEPCGKCISCLEANI